ncbi:hypothetical protein [Candidatus Neptunichlamydia sp. REUL1]|nr:hypothetical protein [Candidatus Neptunochlamydia sp. REUL1]
MFDSFAGFPEITSETDLNPIEHKWAQAKSKRRKYQCGIDELFKEHRL